MKTWSVDGNTDVQDKDKFDFSNKSLKENEVQTKSGYVTVEVLKRSNTYEIVVKESMKDSINKELESIWEEIPINAFSTNKELFTLLKLVVGSFLKALLHLQQLACSNLFPGLRGSL